MAFGPNTMTMHAPGTLPAATIAQIAPTPTGKKKRCGLVPMTPGAMFMLNITSRVEYLTAKDRRLHSHASGAFFCTGCPRPLPKVEGEQVAPYRMSASLADLRAGHTKSPIDMDRDNETHLYGFWSNDPIGAVEKGCKKCEGATAAARKVEGAPQDVLVPCAEHHGGALGLLSPGEPYDAS